MRWIKIIHVGGEEYLNVEQVYRLSSTGSAEVTFYDSNSILPTVYTFSSAAMKNDFLAKFERVFSAINLDQLASQG